MTENVFEFKIKQKKDLVYECSCGCQVFHITEDGNVRCYACSLISNNLRVVDERKTEDE